jgi:hypothetical protein
VPSDQAGPGNDFIYAKNKLYCMVILNLILPSSLCRSPKRRFNPSLRHLDRLNILDRVAGRARYRTSTPSVNRLLK